MPRYQTHLWCNMIVYALVMSILMYYRFKLPSTYGELLVCSSLGSLFPDIDVKSKGQQISYSILCALLVCLICGRRFIIAAGLGVIGMIPLFVDHRGLFHRLWFIAAFSVFVALVLLQCMPSCGERIIMNSIFFLIGAITHVALDGGWRMVTRW